MSTLNIHPILVHFPIAFLSLYVVLEAVRVRTLTRWEGLFPLKAAMVIIGAVSAVIARQSGDLIEDQFASIPSVERVVELHSTIATATTLVFCVLAGIYVLVLLGRSSLFSRLQALSWFKMLYRFSDWAITSGWILAGVIPGVVLLTLTGALGGIIVLGPDTDPITKLVYQFFFK